MSKQGDRNALAKWTHSHGQKFMVAEGQSEPWELSLIPPAPMHYALYSCTPQDIIKNYNFWVVAQIVSRFILICSGELNTGFCVLNKVIIST